MIPFDVWFEKKEDSSHWQCLEFELGQTHFTRSITDALLEGGSGFDTVLALGVGAPATAVEVLAAANVRRQPRNTRRGIVCEHIHQGILMAVGSAVTTATSTILVRRHAENSWSARVAAGTTGGLDKGSRAFGFGGSLHDGG